MTLIGIILVALVAAETSALSVELEILSKIFLPYTYTPSAQYSPSTDAAEQMAYDESTKLLYSVGHTNVHVIDVSDPTHMQVLYHTSEPNVDVTDVEVCGNYVFVSNDNLAKREEGFVDIYSTYNTLTHKMEHIKRIIVGDLPDMIYPTKDCSKLVVALEAEPYDNDATMSLVDNPGEVLIIRFQNTPADPHTIRRLNFKQFDYRIADLERSGVRHVYKEHGNPFSNDVEPEYVAFNQEETKAYIALQENNAIAVVDMVNDIIENIFGLGYKDWSNKLIDVSDRDSGIHLRPWPVYGMYQPDSLKVYKHQGVDYIITSNEGDSKDYKFFSEEVRVKNFGLSSVFESNATTRAWLESDAALGRLKVTTENGFNTATQKFDRLFTYGGRSFSVFRADTMELVFDSGSDIADKTAQHLPHLFNNNLDNNVLVSDTIDTRSDDKGVETESLAVGNLGDVTLLFVGNERPGTVAVYSIDERSPSIQPQFQAIIGDVKKANDTWIKLYNDRSLSMIDCEDMKFISAEKSPNGKPLLLVTGSLSGTVTVIQVNINGLNSDIDDGVMDLLCTGLSHRDCDTVRHEVCASDGVTYFNYCEYQKEKCTHRNLHVAYFGACLHL